MDAKAVDFIGDTEKTVAKAKACLQAAQQRQKKYADEKHMDVQYEVGDMAWNFRLSLSRMLLCATCCQNGLDLSRSLPSLVK